MPQPNVKKNGVKVLGIQSQVMPIQRDHDNTQDIQHDVLVADSKRKMQAPARSVPGVVVSQPPMSSSPLPS